MKRLPGILLAAGLLLPAPSASTQTTLSLHGGLNLAILSNEANDSLLPLNYIRVVRPSYGLSATFRLTPPERVNSLEVQVSGSYAPRGADVQGLSAGSIRLNYLELAALIDVRVPLVIEPLAVHILVGPTLGWLMSCTREQPCRDDEFNPRDYGLALGSNLEIGVTERMSLFAGFLYNAGLTYADTGDEPFRKNRSLALRAGLLIPIG
ncbi:MAG: hypothetical protein OXU69_12265 [Gemmatimonadota bacterium]|nr:hypothetical protein [Gemmatimonadota bacterium]MDE2985471.1 hypothetical protein [Gemmatimonadota bacterium]